jgi:hypothetical protein
MVTVAETSVMLPPKGDLPTRILTELTPPTSLRWLGRGGAFLLPETNRTGGASHPNLGLDQTAAEFAKPDDVVFTVKART